MDPSCLFEPIKTDRFPNVQVEVFSYFIFLIDIACMSFYYFTRIYREALPLDDIDYANYTFVLIYVMLRTFGFMLAQSALALSTGLPQGRCP